MTQSWHLHCKFNVLDKKDIMNLLILVTAIFFSLSTQASEVACMSYEQGVKRECAFLDSSEAANLCSRTYGSRYFPFEVDGDKCSLEAASESRGEVSQEKLIEGLASDIEEIETIMTMVDGQGLEGALGINNFEVSEEFYTDIVKSLMAKMNMFKKELYKRSHFKVDTKNYEIANFTEFSFRYLSVLARLYRLYSAVAHENHFVLKTYDFKNLEYLNLVLAKPHALEVLAVVNYYAKNVNNGKDVELSISQQERQSYEYLSMQSPTTEKDYAKLITFLGLRETVTNLWGIQRMSNKNLGDNEIRSCGNFLSFRPENNLMKESPAYIELLEEDTFRNEYFNRQEELALASREVFLLDDESAIELELHIFNEISEFGDLLKKAGHTIESVAEQFGPKLVEAEALYWRAFSELFFPSIVLRGDGVLVKENILNRIVEDTYAKKTEAIVDTFLGSFGWVSDDSVEAAQSKIEKYLDENLKKSFTTRLYNHLDKNFNYKSSQEVAKSKRSKKIEETLKVAKETAQAAYIANAIREKKLDLEKDPILEPASIAELLLLFEQVIKKDFADVDQTMKHNQELSKGFSDFIKEIEVEFENRFPEDMIEETTRTERAKALREIAVLKAKSLIEKYPFIIRNPKTRNLLLCNEEGTIPVFEDGTPAGLTNEELLERINRIRIGQGPMILDSKKVLTESKSSLSNEELKRRIDRIRVGQGPSIKSDSNNSILEVFGYRETDQESYSLIRERNNPDKLSLGTLKNPLEIVSPGVIRTKSGETSYNHEELVRLFEKFNLIKDSNKEDEVKQSSAEVDLGPSDLVIDNPTMFFFRVLEALELEDAYSAKNIGSFASSEVAQQIQATYFTTQAYQVSPLLRIEDDIKVKKKKYCFVRGTGTPYACDYEETVSISLLDIIARKAYSPVTNSVKDSKAEELIESIIQKTEKNIENKVQLFCNANFFNFKNDPTFKKIFKSSKYLRSTLKSPYGQAKETVQKINEFDESIKNRIRSKSETINEDYLEPTLNVLGIAAVVALGVVMIIGSGGVATPGIMGGAFTAASTFLAIEFFVSFPLMMGSLYTRINTNFIEMPAQLRFQQSLATSQVEGKLIDWNTLNEDQAGSKSSKAWTIGLMPLEFLYGAMLYRHVMIETGATGKAAFERLTGTALKGWSSPPAGAPNMPSFSEMKQHRGILSASWAQMKKPFNKIKSYMPRYVALPENMIRTTALRMGMIRKAVSLDIANSPWKLLKDINEYNSHIKKRLSNYEDFVTASNRVESEIRLNGALRPSEIIKHFKESAVAYLPKTLWQKIKTGKVSEVVNFFTNFGEVWSQMKKAQGLVVGQRAKNIESVANKLEDFKKAVTAGHYKDGVAIEQFLRTLSDQEILMLEEVAKKSRGLMREFKPVFKDYQKVLQGLRPLGYLSGYPGRNFEPSSDYPEEFFRGEVVDIQNSFKSDSEDLLNFYESFMKHQAVKSDELSKLREQLERELREATR